LTVQALTFGLLAETSAQLEDLTDLVKRSGHDIALSIKASSGCLDKVRNVDAWVVRLDLQHDKSEHLMEILESFDVPVIYDDIESYNELGVIERVTRFSSKIQLCAGTSAPQGLSKPREIWVLAASTGGPEAVGRFLKHIPEHMDGVAFLYVQHINPEITRTLQKALLRNTCWAVLECERSQTMVEKCIYLVSPAHQIDLYETRVIAPIPDRWAGKYQPSADQVMAKVARRFGKNSGAIIFSGMGNDGSSSCHYMKGCGGLIWAQSPSSCAVDSMPVSALGTGAVSYLGSPEQLARQFAERRHPKAACM